MRSCSLLVWNRQARTGRGADSVSSAARAPWYMDTGSGRKSEYFEHPLVVSLTAALSLITIQVKLGLPWLFLVLVECCVVLV